MKKKIVVWGIGVALALVIIESLKQNGVNDISDIFINRAALENTYFIMQIVCGVSVIIGAIIGVWQYTLTARCERAKMNTDRVEKAINLAEYYKNEILSKYEAIIYVFREGNIQGELSKIKKSDMKEFTKEELSNLLSDADAKKLEEAMQSKQMVEAIINAEVVFGLDLHVKQYISVSDNQGKVSVDVKNPDAIKREFMSNIVSEVLNATEYFAMNFTHDIADESVVYQSLNRTYVEMIQLLYYNIAKNNTVGKPKLYTNTIELYLKWYEKQQKQREKVMKSANNVNKGTVVCNRLD